MSDPTAPAPPPPPPAGEAIPLPAPPLEPAPPQAGGPYRVPEPPDAPVWPPMTALPKTHPVLGPALSTSAVLLWSFVVAGQLTTSWFGGGPLPQALAVLFVLVTTSIAWIASVRASGAVAPPRVGAHLVGRAVLVFLLAFLFFVVSIVIAAIAGNATSRDHDLLIATALVATAWICAAGGPRVLSPTPLVRSPRATTLRRLAWAAGALVTLVAGAQLAIRG